MVMSPALPSIMRDLGISASVGQWLTSIFLLVNGLMIPVTAFLIGRFSTRQLFFAAMLIFTAGTVVAAFSGSFLMLMAGRVLQAVGAGIQLPFVSVTMMLIFPKEKRGFAMGMVGVVMGVAPTVGPAAAGWIVDAWGWNYIFFAIAPLAVLDMILAFFLLKNLGMKEKNKLDWLSVLLSTLSFGGLLYGFSAAGSFGWIHPETLGPIGLGGICLVFFIRRQLKRKPPLLDLRILKNPVFSTATVLSMVVSAGMTVGAVITPIFLQDVLGLSAMNSGLILMPGALLMAAMSPVSGMLFDRFGPRILCICGLSILTAGSGMMAFIGTETVVPYVLVAYTFRLLGISLVNMPLNTWGINALSNRKIPHGNAINNTGRQVAGSMGTAILVTVMMLVSGDLETPDLASTALGIDAAFGGAALLTLAALIMAVFKVKKQPESDEDY
jgi:EmrB/QacA subfamily drug resistance transporter